MKNKVIIDPATGERVTYRGNKDNYVIKRKMYEINKRRYDRLKAEGKCKECMELIDDLERSKTVCTKCLAIGAANTKRRNLEIKLEAMEQYGGAKCANCGLTGHIFLTFDHVDNNGNVHRREDPTVRAGMARWLKKNNYPPGFQVLCWNCNMGKQLNGGILPTYD